MGTDRCGKNIENQKKCVGQAKKKVTQKRNDLILCMQKHKTLEKLKEKERLAFQQKIIQKEHKLMDEVASTRHARKR